MAKPTDCPQTLDEMCTQVYDWALEIYHWGLKVREDIVDLEKAVNALEDCCEKARTNFKKPNRGRGNKGDPGDPPPPPPWG